MRRWAPATTGASWRTSAGGCPAASAAACGRSEAAALALEAGAREVIIGSALFTAHGTDAAFAASLAAACGASRVIAAVDALGGRVAVKGWKETLAISPADAARQLEPWCGGVLYTHIDTEGLMGGIDMEAVRNVRDATSRRLSAAGGITTWDEIHALDAMGIDAVVGMAVYTGTLELEGLGTRRWALGGRGRRRVGAPQRDGVTD